MPPTGAWCSIWAAERDDYDSQELKLDCLLPTGIIVQLEHVSKNAALADIKNVILILLIILNLFPFILNR